MLRGRQGSSIDLRVNAYGWRKMRSFRAVYGGFGGRQQAQGIHGVWKAGNRTRALIGYRRQAIWPEHSWCVGGRQQAQGIYGMWESENNPRAPRGMGGRQQVQGIHGVWKADTRAQDPIGYGRQATGPGYPWDVGADSRSRVSMRCGRQATGPGHPRGLGTNNRLRFSLAQVPVCKDLGLIFACCKRCEYFSVFWNEIMH